MQYEPRREVIVSDIVDGKVIYNWQDISLDEYTINPVRDVFYKYRFYKLEDDSFDYKDFSSLDEVEEGYDYFRISDFVQQSISDSYYLDNNLNSGKAKTINNN